MKMDVSELFRKKVTHKNISLIVNGDEVFNEKTDIKINNPINVEGVLSLSGDVLHFDGHINCDIILQCSRCTEEFVYSVDIEAHEEFSHNDENEDDNIIFIEGDNIDITDIIENNILLALPIKPLCSENCKGLCQSCGTNLNIGTCKCDNIEVDPRLAQLKDFFTTR